MPFILPTDLSVKYLVGDSTESRVGEFLKWTELIEVVTPVQYSKQSSTLQNQLVYPLPKGLKNKVY